MTNLEPCPFCDSADLTCDRVRIGCGVNAVFEHVAPDPRGEWFRVTCGCGCRLERCADALYEDAELRLNPEHEVTDDDLWEQMRMEWNVRGVRK